MMKIRQGIRFRLNVDKLCDLDLYLFQNDSGIISLDEVTYLDPKDVTLKDFLIVPETPNRKLTKKNFKRSRQFVMTSELYKMEEKIKIDEKIAKEKAQEERNKQLEERKQKLEEKKAQLEVKKVQMAEKKLKLDQDKAKKVQLAEIKKIEKIKAAAEKDAKARKRAADSEKKL